MVVEPDMCSHFYIESVYNIGMVPYENNSYFEMIKNAKYLN